MEENTIVNDSNDDDNDGDGVIVRVCERRPHSGGTPPPLRFEWNAPKEGWGRGSLDKGSFKCSPSQQHP